MFIYGVASKYLAFYTILNKLFLLDLTIWCSAFGIYVFLISMNKSNRENTIKYMKKINTIYLLIDIILGLLIVYLPVEFKFRNGAVMYSFGPAVDVVYFGSCICIGLMLYCLIKNYKNIKNRKYLPIYVYLVIGVFIGIIQKIYPELLLFTSMEAFITVLMYFTIENPDMKLLKEVHDAKEISDNANEEKTLFLYNMMQEIRETTKNIDEEADLILDGNIDDEGKEHVRNIKGETSKFRMMTNDILDVSAIDSSSIKIYNSKYNLKLLLKSLVGSYTEVCKNKLIEFRTNIEHDIPDMLY